MPSTTKPQSSEDLRELRLRNQRISQPDLRTGQSVVSWLGAVQSQEFTLAKWGLGLRGKGLTEAAIDREFDEGRILRTHILRPTWHFVAPADIRWMLAVSGPRVHTANAHPYRRTGLDAASLSRSRKVIERALAGGKALTRTELAARFARSGIVAAGMLLAYIVMHAELEGVICSGPRRGKQFTYMLLEERVPRAKTLTRDEALAELVRRYFTSHGPATIQDFCWWSGMTVRDTKMGLDSIAPEVVRETVDGKSYWMVPSTAPTPRQRDAVDLLPIYDEYLISYKDRTAMQEPLKPGEKRVDDDYGSFLMIDGKLAGRWRRVEVKSSIEVVIRPYRNLTRSQQRGLTSTLKRFSEFAGSKRKFLTPDS
jgi:hypothetical protein